MLTIASLNNETKQSLTYITEVTLRLKGANKILHKLGK